MSALLALLLAGAAQPAQNDTVAIIGGTVAIGDGSQPIPNGVVVLSGGRIIAAGEGIPIPADAQRIDARGEWVAAGMVAGFSSLGLYEIDGIREANDTVAPKSRFSASLDAATAINPAGSVVALERSGGITKAIVSPSAQGSIFAGEGAVMDLGTSSPAVMTKHAFELVELGEDGAASAGGSRPAAYAMLHEALAESAAYHNNPKAFATQGAKPLFAVGDLAVLADVLDGKIILLAHVERASDIRAALALRTEYPHIRLVLLGATEGWLVASDIARARVPVIATALSDVPEQLERVAASESNVGHLTKAGVRVAISTINMTEPVQQRRLNQQAGNLVAISRVPGMTGLDWGQAFAAITSRPAQALGLDNDIGSLRPGRRADVVIWNGDPLELKSAPVRIFIDGVEQPLATRQSELLKRYQDQSTAALPPAYRR